MNLRFETENDFIEFKKELSARLASWNMRRFADPVLTPAAVMMLIMNKNNEAHVLLTRRTHEVATHKGEVSFPGGKFDESDGSILEAAYRETFEEVGVKDSDIDYIGEFDHYFSIQGFHVSTYIGAIKHPYNYNINRAEIEDIVEAPISIFYNLEYEKRENLEYNGAVYDVFYYQYNGFNIWGLTARILTDFSQKILKE